MKLLGYLLHLFVTYPDLRNRRYQAVVMGVFDI